MRMPFLPSMIGLALAAAIFAGCQFKGESTQSTLEMPQGVWLPSPASLRIYPSTRFIREDGQTLLDTRIEFTDEMGDTIKAAGDLRLMLFASDAAGTTLGRQLFNWQVQLQTLEDQQQYYDAITRTYFCRLRLDEPAIARKPTVLRVSFTPATGKERIEAQARVRSD